MAIREIPIKHTLYVMNVRTHSNRYVVRTFCLECLSNSKTNKQYTDYETVPMISNNRVCSSCGAMTTTAVNIVFLINRSELLKYIEKGTIIEGLLSTEQVKFVSTPSDLLILKAEIKNGKKRRN